MTFRITYNGKISMKDFEIREVHIEDAERLVEIYSYYRSRGTRLSGI